MKVTPRRIPLRLQALVLLLVLPIVVSVRAGERQTLRGHVPLALARLQPAERLPATNRMRLAIGLPLRHRGALSNFLQQLYDPASTVYRRYLTPGEFTQRFGPTEQDYQTTIRFATAHGLTVAALHPNRMLLDVDGTVADVERALHVRMQVYPHPTEARTFFAPDVEPSLEIEVPVLHISGLDSLVTPRPMSLRERPPVSPPTATPRGGSAPDGSYMGSDFRAAYVPGTTLTGSGQVVGLFELNGYYASDISTYESQAGLPQVPLQNVLIDGFNGAPGGRRPGSPNEEVALDIEVTISMAPGLSQVIVYEGAPDATTATIDDVLNRMATDNLARQLSCSWGFDIDATSQQIFQEYAAQGQSFFLASGDSGAFVGPVLQPSDNPYVTVVGGTVLTTDAAQGWLSETAWNGSSGGISTLYPIPSWQEGIDMSASQGSTAMRNVPDVAMVADNVLTIADRGQSLTLSGTSIAAPLWAGFTALVNEQAAAERKPPVGFLNPAIYAVGKGPGYATAFHDVATGDNTTTNSPGLFFAVPGYDLCTGWGSPNGTQFINALLHLSPADPLVITPPLGFTANGPVGGPFNATAETYSLTNAGTAPLSWTLDNPADWLHITPSSGTLRPGGPATTVTVSLNSTASNLLIGAYTATVTFTDTSSGFGQNRPFSLLAGNGGFETGDFANWTLAADPTNNFANSVDATQFYGSSALPGVDDSAFVHSGIYGAFLGQPYSPGYLSQTLPTVAGQLYRLSFWLANPAPGTPNEFSVAWDGNTLFDQLNMDSFAWTNLQYVVTATGASTLLQFGFQNDQNAFALDDVSVELVPAPRFESVNLANGTIRFTWHALAGLNYQIQSTTDLNAAGWTDRGALLTLPADTTLTTSDSIGAAPRRFYRVVLVP